MKREINAVPLVEHTYRQSNAALPGQNQTVAFVDNRTQTAIQRTFQERLHNNNPSRQTAPIQQPLHIGGQPKITQRKLYNGEHEFQTLRRFRTGLQSALQNYGVKIASKERYRMADFLWETYGGNVGKDMEVGTIAKVLRDMPDRRGVHIVGQLRSALNNVEDQHINLPGNFPERILKDSRISDNNLKFRYIYTWKRKKKNYKAYKDIKQLVQEERKKREGYFAEEVGAYFQEGKWMNTQNNALDTVDDKDHALDILTVPVVEVEREENAAITEVMEKLTERVLAFKDDLRGVFYYSDKGHREIEEATGLRSQKVRDEAPKENPGAKIKHKAQRADLDNHTNDYVFMFIEHKDALFNIGTRFASHDARPGDSTNGRRRRFPLKKILKKEGATVMIGDLYDDATGHIYVDTEEEQVKVFRHGGHEDRVNGVLTNMMAALENRLRNAYDPDILKMILDSLKNLLKDGISDETVWSYLVRYLIQPQLMAPREITHGMKGQRIDNPITEDGVRKIKSHNESKRRYLKNSGVTFLPSDSALKELNKLKIWKNSGLLEHWENKKIGADPAKVLKILDALKKYGDLEDANALRALDYLEFENNAMYRELKKMALPQFEKFKGTQKEKYELVRLVLSKFKGQDKEDLIIANFNEADVELIKDIDKWVVEGEKIILDKFKNNEPVKEQGLSMFFTKKGGTEKSVKDTDLSMFFTKKGGTAKPVKENNLSMFFTKKGGTEKSVKDADLSMFFTKKKGVEKPVKENDLSMFFMKKKEVEKPVKEEDEVNSV